jgi:DNA-directed RNA polymerase III subunit RPC3
MNLEDDHGLKSGIVLNSRKPKDITLVKAYLSMLAFVDNPTPAGKAASFVSFTGSKIYVEFEIIATRLRRRVLEAVTRERHGDDGVRVLRLLLDSGKVDEKQVCFYFDWIYTRVFRGYLGVKACNDCPKRCPAVAICDVCRISN